MKITVNRIAGGPCRFEDFADANGLEMVVDERDWAYNTPNQYYARFNHVEIMDRGMLVSAFGNGMTVDSAIAEYKHSLVGKRIAYKAGGGQDRREIQCPMEWL